MEVVGHKMNGAAIGEIPAPITSFPQHIMSFPQHIMSFPQHIMSFQQHIMSFQQHIMSFQRRRESPVLRSTTYPWEYPSPRKVTGRIRRMVRGWAHPDFRLRGNDVGVWECSGRHGGHRSVCTLRLPLICPSKGYARVS